MAPSMIAIADAYAYAYAYGQTTRRGFTTLEGPRPISVNGLARPSGRVVVFKRPRRLPDALVERRGVCLGILAYGYWPDIAGVDGKAWITNPNFLVIVHASF